MSLGSPGVFTPAAARPPKRPGSVVVSHYNHLRSGVFRGRSGEGFSPTSLPGYVDSPFDVAALRSGGFLFQDAAGATPAVADGDRVRLARCGATDYTAASDAASPLLYDEGGSKWSLEFDGIDDRLTATPPAWVGSVGSQMIALAFVDTTPAANLGPLGINGRDDWMAFGSQDNYSYSFRSARAELFFNFTPAAPLTYCQTSGADYRAYIDAVLKATTTTAWEAPTTINVGWNSAGYTAFRTAGLTLAAAGWDAATVTRLQAYYAALM